MCAQTPPAALSALPTHFTQSPPFLPPPLTAFTPLPLSPPGRPCCPWLGFSNLLAVFRGFQCVPNPPPPPPPSPPSPLSPPPLPSALRSSAPTALSHRPATLRHHHHHPHCPHRSPPSLLYNCSHHLAAQSWLHRHPPTTTHTALSASPTLPQSPPSSNALVHFERFAPSAEIL